MTTSRNGRPSPGAGSPAKHKLALSQVQETLLMPLYARAWQSDKRFSLLRDPKAVEIVQSIDYDFSKFEKSPQTQLGCVLRTLQFDAWVKDFLSRHPQGVIVDVGAGLNSRFERTDNGQAHFFELDLPEAMAVREQFFAENPRRTHITGSVLDDAWIDQVQAAAAPCMIIIEGVLMYLNENEVRSLFSKVLERLPGSYLGFDSLSTGAVENQHRMAAMRHFEANFHWGIDEPRQIESWQPGIVCVDSLNLRQVAVRNRHIIPALVQLIATALVKAKRTAINDYLLTLFRFGPP